MKNLLHLFTFIISLSSKNQILKCHLLSIIVYTIIIYADMNNYNVDNVFYFIHDIIVSLRNAIVYSLSSIPYFLYYVSMTSKKVTLRSKIPETLILSYMYSMILYLGYAYILAQKRDYNYYSVVLLLLLTSFCFILIQLFKEANKWNKIILFFLFMVILISIFSIIFMV